jgi:hypothetical protein
MRHGIASTPEARKRHVLRGRISKTAEKAAAKSPDYPSRPGIRRSGLQHSQRKLSMIERATKQHEQARLASTSAQVYWAERASVLARTGFGVMRLQSVTLGVLQNDG